MIGYAGVEGVIYRAWMRILEQTESGEVIIIWSPPSRASSSISKGGEDGLGAEKSKSGEEEKRSINPVEGWGKAWENVESEMMAVKEREKTDPQGRMRSTRGFIQRFHSPSSYVL